MSFFKKIYRTTPTSSEIIGATLNDPTFRFSDMLGGAIAARCEMNEGKLSGRERKDIIRDAFSFALYHLIASGRITVNREHYRQTFFGSLERDTSKIVLERQPAAEVFDQRESPLLEAIYAAADGQRTLGNVVKIVLDGYMGPGQHTSPVSTLFSALLQGEMRYWRLEHQTANWGFTRYYALECLPEHRPILMDSVRSARTAIAAISGQYPQLFGVLRDFTGAVKNSLYGRKRQESKHHYPRKPHRGRRRKKDDPRMWTDG